MQIVHGKAIMRGSDLRLILLERLGLGSPWDDMLRWVVDRPQRAELTQKTDGIENWSGLAGH